MSALLGCIADDFTGATDLAGLLARSGRKVSLRIGVPTEPIANPAPFEVIALKIRNLPAQDARAQAVAALAWLRGAGASRFFWKYCSTFDSTAEGNIGPVAEALMAELGAEQTVYCPAFPENGRSIYMGQLFVGEQPLSESPMKDHPLTPMRDSNLMRLLEPQVKGGVGLANQMCVARGVDRLKERFGVLKAESVSHVIVDAVADHDLTVIAEACSEMPLMTGGSALAMPLPNIYAQQGLLSDAAPEFEQPRIPKGAVILSGSCSAMTNAQVAAYRATNAPAYQIDPLKVAKSGSQTVLDWLRLQDLTKAPLIYATAQPEAVSAAQAVLGTQAAGALIESTLADCAKAALDMGAGRFVVAGGETSGAVTQALGIDHLDVGSEIAPGVPWCHAISGQANIAITLKSGNFGAERFFADALEALKR